MTTTDIQSLQIHIPTARLMKLAIDNCAATYGKAALLASEAYQMFDEAVDRNESKELRDDLYTHYEFALCLQHEAYEQWNAAKRDLLQMYAN